MKISPKFEEWWTEAICLILKAENSVKEIYASFVEYILGENVNPFAGHMDDLGTVRERVDEFASGDELPGYMKERYRKG